MFSTDELIPCLIYLNDNIFHLRIFFCVPQGLTSSERQTFAAGFLAGLYRLVLQTADTLQGNVAFPELFGPFQSVLSQVTRAAPCSRKVALGFPFSLALKTRHGIVLKLSSLVAASHTCVFTDAAQGEAFLAPGAAKSPP